MHLLIFGLGYSGQAIARAALAAGFTVTATSRSPGSKVASPVRIIPFDDAVGAISQATHMLATAPPRDAGDPVLARYAGDIRTAEALQWIGYLSTTGVYGDRGGAWVDEATQAAPSSERSQRRLEAEGAWTEVAAGRPLDLFRLAGIYGPGRSALDEVRAGRARPILSAGHAFGRIYVEDIAGGVMAAIAHPPAGMRVLNFSDDEPAEPASVIAEAAALAGVPAPLAIPLAQARAGMSEMALSFWAENRRVRSKATQDAIGYRWQAPTYREGLRAILAAEAALAS
jgi:nucleoside-diphosphate-sugar epimerase